jgi:hypothetical protein
LTDQKINSHRAREYISLGRNLYCLENGIRGFSDWSKRYWIWNIL